MTTSYPYLQYGGIWKLNAASAAKGAGTWPVPPAPKLYAWGNNGFAQLGLGNQTNYSSPKQVGSLVTWSKIFGIRNSTFATKTDGTLWSWGANAFGQLGTGNTTYYSSPKQLGALTNWLKTSTNFGAQAAHAIKTDGTLWSWGQNTYGQLGLGNRTNYSSPKQVGNLTDWAEVGQSNFACFAVKANGTLWSWGAGLYGVLGLGNTTYYSSPKQVGSLTNWLKVAGGNYHVLAVKTNGTLWAWGRNDYGQTGKGTSGSYEWSPLQIGSLSNWASVFAASESSYAIKTDGTLWSWGFNIYGQLGLGNTTSYSSPKQVGSLTTWLSMASSYGNTTSIKTDGTLWTWGRNNFGQLGLGNTTNYSSPKQVGALTSWNTVGAGYYSSFGIAVT